LKDAGSLISISAEVVIDQRATAANVVDANVGELLSLSVRGGDETALGSVGTVDSRTTELGALRNILGHLNGESWSSYVNRLEGINGDLSGGGIRARGDLERGVGGEGEGSSTSGRKVVEGRN
jgi:hypothetical protein